MSSIKCPCCGRNISKHANVCIWCKCPLNPAVTNTTEELENNRKIEAHKERWEKKEQARLAQIRAIESRKIHCPYCGSLDVRRNMGFAGGGFFAPSASVGKNWKCKHCGSYF